MSYENINIYEINIIELIRNCNNNNNKSTKWYTKAFGILIDYYNSFINYNIKLRSKQINIIGQALNCIINNLNRIPTKNDIQNMDYNMNFHLNNGTSNILIMASEFIKNKYVILNDIVQYWVKHRDIIIEETSSNSTSQESYSTDESLPEWDENGDDIRKHCSKTKNRDKRWYLIAYYNLLKYYKKLQININTHKIIKNIGFLFNCMVYNVYGNVKNKSDVENIQSKITIGSKFQHDSKLDNKQIIEMNFILNKWYEAYRNYYKYRPYHQKNSNQQSSNIEDSDVLNHCTKKIKNKYWYVDGWSLLFGIHKKIHDNLLPKNTGYASIGHLLNCLVNNTDADPIFNSTQLILIHERLQNKDSSFYFKSKLDTKYKYFNYLYKEWYFAYGKKGGPYGSY